MAITRANLPALLRAATALHPPHIPHHNSPTSFLRSHPSNILISNPHLFSTFLYRRVRPRATAYPNPQNLPTISNPLNLISISNHHLLSRSLHTHATALHRRDFTYDLVFALTFGCIAAAGGGILFCKILEKPTMIISIGHKLEVRFSGIFPHKYRWERCVVVEGLARPYSKDVGADGPWEFYISATEVSDLHYDVFQRNQTILAVKKIYSEDNDIIFRTHGGEIKIPIPDDDLSKSGSKSIVPDFNSEPDDPRIIQLVLFTFDKFQDLPKLLGEGHSVFIQGFTNLPLNSNMNEIIRVRSDINNWHRIVKGKTEKMEYLLVAEAITKDDERYMPREGVAAAVGGDIGDRIRESSWQCS